jgi:hypothetical protein
MYYSYVCFCDNPWCLLLRFWSHQSLDDYYKGCCYRMMQKSPSNNFPHDDPSQTIDRSEEERKETIEVMEEK